MVSAFAAARPSLEERLKAKPEDARTLCVLAQIDAGLGKKKQAITEAKHAVQLMPMDRDAYDAPLVLEGLARVYTWTGEKDLAVETLRRVLSVPSYLTVTYLQKDPAWEPLWDYPAFQALLGQFPVPAARK